MPPPVLMGGAQVTATCPLPTGVACTLVDAPGATALTTKLCGTGGAAAQIASPDWVAVMVQVPAPTSVTMVPATVQTASVLLAKPTVNVEVALANSGGTEVPKLRSGKGAKVIVCVFWGVAWQESKLYEPDKELLKQARVSETQLPPTGVVALKYAVTLEP